jgi:hypothetical protein
MGEIDIIIPRRRDQCPPLEAENNTEDIITQYIMPYRIQ